MTRGALALRVGSSVACCVALLACDLRVVELAPNAQNAIVVGDVPQSAIDKLRSAGAPPSDAARLAFVYPIAASALPQDLAPLPIEWQATGGKPPKAPKPAKDEPKPAKAADPMMMVPMMPGPMAMDAAPPPDLISELRVRSPTSETRLYTRGHEAVLPAARWRTLLRESTGAALTLELRALFVGSNEIYSAERVQLQIRGPVPAGALYYWSTTAQGVVRARIDEARTTFVAPEASPDAGGGHACGGCHALARDGRRLLIGRDSPARLDAYSLPERAPMWPGDAPAPAYGWGTFDPTASRIAISSDGALRLYDADSGQPLAQAELAADVRVGHPDWSPDGRFIAVALWPAASAGTDENVSGSSIARVRVALDGSLEAPEVLVAPMGKDETLLFPSYSPDGAWLAFERTKGASKEAKDASLWLVAAGGGKPIELERAAAEEKPRASDSMPTWMPADRPQQLWLLFSSTRSRGSHTLAPNQEQLFATAIDIEAAARGEDPSQPAFWLPSQELTSSNHRALFAPDVAACVAALEICDGRDQDCDDEVDEDCCEPVAERCDDARDDDCDGRSDEGCGCAFVETCGDTVDDDCDGRLDEDCAPMPPP